MVLGILFQITVGFFFLLVTTLVQFLKASSFWTVFGALCTFFGAFFTFGCLVGVWFVWKQFRLAAWANAQEIFTDYRFTYARTRVQEHFGQQNYTPNSGDIKAAKLVCRKMDQLSCLAYKGLMCKQEILKHWAMPMGKCWIVVEKYWHVITDERKDKCKWPEKWHAFYKLGRDAAKQKGLI